MSADVATDATRSEASYRCHRTTLWMPKERTTCTECSIRRQRCDRETPCGRCVKRGVADRCTRIWSSREEARSHRVSLGRQVRQDTSTEIDSPNPGQMEMASGNSALSTFEHASLPTDSTRRSASIPPDEATSDYGAAPVSTHLDGHNSGDNDALESNELILQSPSITTSQCLLIDGLVPSQSPLPPGFPDLRATSLALLELHLPSVSQIWSLVDYHEKFLLWYHGCYHGPTFRHELEESLENHDDSLPLAVLDLQWVALLFSIMAGSMACANRNLTNSWRFKEDEVSRLSKQWYKATSTCLDLAEYTYNHHIHAVHAITTLTMSAHTLGFSEDILVMLGSALRIAQSLGLNRLELIKRLENIAENSPQLQRVQVLEREIGRRLWSQLCVQDWFSLPFTGCQTICLSDFTAIKPSNRNHITMEPLPEATPTYISYGNYVNDIARLVAEHHASKAQSSTAFLMYEKVLQYDAKMRNLARNEMPAYFNVTTPIEESWACFIPWARRSLTICFAHKIIMIHRDFIRRSFINPAFQMTRNTCIAASKTILREAKQEQQEDGPVIWIDQAFCIVAGIILCLDIIHQHTDHPEYATHTNMVNECIAMLQKYETSLIARRGVCILSTLLSERKKLVQPWSASRKRAAPRGDTDAQTSKRNKIDLTSVRNALAFQVDRDHEIGHCVGKGAATFVRKQIAELLPPQAGFSNSFLFGELLDFTE